MAFDPDAYLAGSESKGFDPDAYLAGNSSPKKSVTLNDALSELISPITKFGRSVVEPAITAVRGLAGMAGGGFAGMAADAYSGLTGQARVGDDVNRAVQQKIMGTPSPDAQASLDVFAKVFEASRIPPMPGVTGLPGLSRAVSQQMPLITSKAGSALEARQQRIAARAEAAAQESRMNAPKLDAAQKAKIHGIGLDPAEIDPTIANRIKRAVVGGENVGVAISKSNEPQWAEVAKRAIGIDKESPITYESLNAARAEAGKSFDAVRGLGTIADDGATLSEIKGLLSDPLIGGRAAHKSITNLISDAEKNIASGMDSSKILDNISQLRKDARGIYAMEDAGRKKLAVADTSIGIANALEGMIERHLQKTGQTGVMNAYRDGRQTMAKSYTVEKATNLDTGKVDPAVIARMTRKDNALTGELADIGKIANNFPSTSRIGAKLADDSHPHLARSGLGGALGGAVGFAFGGPGGAAIGVPSGAAVGRATEYFGAGRMANPKFQAGINIPDARPLREQMGYGRAVPPADIPPTITPGPSFSLPPEPLPYLRDAPPLIPGTERAPMQPQPAGRSPFPVLPDQLRPLSEQYPQSIPIGQAEGAARQANTPLPSLPPQASPIMELSASTGIRGGNRPTATMDFPLRQEVLQQLEPQITAFRQEAARLESIANSKYPISGKPQAEAAMQLNKLQQEFAAGMKQLGVDTAADAHGLNRALYQGGQGTKLPIEKTMRLQDLIP